MKSKELWSCQAEVVEGRKATKGYKKIGEAMSLPSNMKSIETK